MASRQMHSSVLLRSPCHSARMLALLLLAVMDVAVLLCCLELESEHCTFSRDWNGKKDFSRRTSLNQNALEKELSKITKSLSDTVWQPRISLHHAAQRSGSACSAPPLHPTTGFGCGFVCSPGLYHPQPLFFLPEEAGLPAKRHWWCNLCPSKRGEYSIRPMYQCKSPWIYHGKNFANTLPTLVLKPQNSCVQAGP